MAPRKLLDSTSRGAVLPLALALAPIASAFSVDLGSLTPAGSSTEAQRIALAVLVLGCVLGTLSFVLVFLSVLEYAGRLFLARCFNYTVAHAVLAVLWLGEIGLAAYLLASTQPALLPAVAFVAGGAVLAAAHVGFILVATCWCCCGGAFVGSPADLNPKSALLTPQQGGTGHHHRGTGGAAGGGAGAGGAHPLAHGDGGSSSGPFRASYGLLPGSNAYAYQIFIPGSDEEQAAFGAYASLPTPTGQARSAPAGQQHQRTPARGGETGGSRKAGHSVQPFAPQPPPGQQLQPMRQ